MYGIKYGMNKLKHQAFKKMSIYTLNGYSIYLQYTFE